MFAAKELFRGMSKYMGLGLADFRKKLRGCQLKKTESSELACFKLGVRNLNIY